MPIHEFKNSRHILDEEDENFEDEQFKQLQLIPIYDPSITIEIYEQIFDNNEIKSIVILPPHLSLFQNEFINIDARSIGSIIIEYPDLYPTNSLNSTTTSRRIRREQEIDPQFNQGEQLYRISNKRENINHKYYRELTIPIMYLENDIEIDNENEKCKDKGKNEDGNLGTSSTIPKGVLIITIPKLVNIFLNNVLARRITQTLNEWFKNLNWFVLAPGSNINDDNDYNHNYNFDYNYNYNYNHNQGNNYENNLENNQIGEMNDLFFAKLLIYKSINTFNQQDFETLNGIPDLLPPHTISGISAAMISQLSLYPNINTVGLVLNSLNGSSSSSSSSSNFTRFELEAIIYIAYALRRLLCLNRKNGEEFIAGIFKRLQTIESLSNSNLRMYI